MPTGAGDVDVLKWVAIVTAALFGLHHVHKLLGRFRQMQDEQPGITIHNGDLRDLQAAIRRIESSQHKHGKRLDFLNERVEFIEQRLTP